MTNERFFELLSKLDDDIIEGSEDIQKTKTVTHIIRWSSFAASFCLVAVLLHIVVFPMINKEAHEDPHHTLPAIPTYENALYSANEINSFFFDENESYSATSSYYKKYVPSYEYLKIDPIPSDEYISLYKHNDLKKDLDKTEFCELINSINERFAKQVGVIVPKCEPEELTETGTYEKILTFLPEKLGKYFIIESQSGTDNSIMLGMTLNSADEPGMILGGVKVEIDQRDNDEEIASSLSTVKEKLFEILGVRFSDIKIVRGYQNDGKDVVDFINVYLYNEIDNPLNGFSDGMPFSDNICVSFENPEKTKSKDILKHVDVFYHQYRVSPAKLYEETKKAKLIPISEAEALLYNGYVFGGYYCPICMGTREEIVFDRYDYVDIEYIEGKGSESIPFYAFYKKIGMSENGNEIYAKTYVPAIEVNGYEEYFKAREQEHQYSTEK